jgi:predicted  nucleic acid-binding Zn-ribbon protein
VNVLVEIAELEELHVQARQTLENNTSREDDLRALQAEYEADARQAEEQAHSRARGFRAINLEVREAETRLALRREQLIGVSDRRQHRALTEEISFLENKLEQLEEEAILQLENEESTEAEAAQLRQESGEREGKTRRELEDMASQSGNMSERLAHIDQDLHRLVSMLPPAEKRHIERLRAKLDRSVVFHHNGACCGCFSQLPEQEAINVDRGRALVRCPSCLRYIVHRPWK